MPCDAVANCGQLVHAACRYAARTCANPFMQCLGLPGTLLPARSRHILLCRAYSAQPFPAMACYAVLIHASAPMACVAMPCVLVTAPSSHVWLCRACWCRWCQVYYVARARASLIVPFLLCHVRPCPLIRAMSCCAVHAGDGSLEHVLLMPRVLASAGSCQVLLRPCQLWPARSCHYFL